MAILLVSVPDDIDGLDDTDGLNEDLLVAARMDWEPPVVALRTTLPDGDFDLSPTLAGRAFACALGFAETTLDVETWGINSKDLVSVGVAYQDVTWADCNLLVGLEGSVVGEWRRRTRWR